MWLLSYGPKTSRPIRMQNSFNDNISQASWCVKSKFCMWLNIHISNKFIQLFPVGVFRHTKIVPNSVSASSGKGAELYIKLVFCMWLWIHSSYNFFQLFQVGVARHAQNDWEQWVSHISKMNLDINLIFCFFYW